MASPNRWTRRSARRGAALVAGAILLLSRPDSALAQDGFLFKRPLAGITLRVGPTLYGAGGDLFGQLRQDLTLERSDFAAPLLGADLVIAPHPRLDLVLGISHAEASSPSEFRDWEDSDGRPIEQTTRLRTIPITASVRYQLLSRGRTISRVSWVPATINAYVGGGGGVAWYRLEHRGDFIDYRDNSIYWSHMEASGSDRVLHLLAGGDYWFAPRVGVNAEVRRTWGHAKPDNGFRTFDRVDMGATQATLGLSFRW
jgi:hypothetical protein